MEVKEVIRLEIYIGELHKKISFPVGPTGNQCNLRYGFYWKVCREDQPKGKHYHSDEFKPCHDRGSNVLRQRPDYRKS